MIYYNNKNTITFLDIKKIIYYYQIKYIDIRHHYIKERIENRKIKLLYVFIFKIIVDGLIKPLSTPLFVRSIG